MKKLGSSHDDENLTCCDRSIDLLKAIDMNHYKYFVLCYSENRLPTWLKLLFRTQSLIDNYYQDWSYVARTGLLNKS